ncbi:hypothetical protein RUM44_010690 [Polyplax serrata]|uniref:RRM domain-containing protein n=1 Tax=Polyplax serrata TaxID=468196 RepID=A0ABR1AN79_POLSC
MKLSPIKGFGLCIMLKCLNSDKPNKVLTEEEYHSKENENHSKENEGLLPKQSSNRSNNGGTRKNTQLKPHNYSPWVTAVDLEYDGPASNVRWGIPKGLCLRGGGENSLNTGTSGWGTPAASGGSGWGGNPPGPPPGQWGANRPPGQSNTNSSQQQGTDFNQNKTQTSGQQPGPSQNQNNAQQSQQQGGSNSQPSSSQGQNQPGNNAPNTSWAQAAGKGLPTTNQNQNSAQSSATKQLEQLNNMREALFSQDGWGGQHVNQDTNWETPGSPEQGIKNDPQGAGGSASGVTTPIWKPNVNNGTDLWEANLRNGGQPPPQQQNKTPWNHTPSSNLGGTWGEEDESGDSSNVWTGVPPNSTNNSWPGPNNATNWPAAPEKKAEWTGGASGAAGPGWADPRGVAMDSREMNRDMHGSVMRGDPRGVSGRLSNTSEMWAMQQQHQMQQPQQQQHPPNKMGPSVPPGGANQWPGGNLPKDLTNMPGNPPKPTGWEEPSPPTQKRNIPNYDDGTSLWGQQQTRTGMQPQGTAPNKNLSHWKDLPAGSMGRGNMPCPPGMPQNRMPGAGANMKPDNPVWGHPPRNGAWDSHEGGPPVGGWGEEGKGPSGNWTSEPLTSPSWPGGPKPAKATGWTEDLVDSSWVHPSLQRQQMPKQFSKDLIWASKPFKMLSEMNFKKEDVENALRTTNMSVQDAFEILTASSRMPEAWNRRQDEHSFDHSGAPFSRGFNPGQQVSFPPSGPGNVANNPATAGLLNNLTNNPGLAPINNIKVLSQQLPTAQQPNNQLNQGQQRPGTSQPSQQQLKMLVQQIQMAVQAGYLNHQILNQSLAPQTLILLNQLLQQIKILQQLNQQHNLMSLGGQLKNSSTALQLSNQIAAQQAAYVKQHAHLMPQSDPPVDLFKSNLTDPLNAIQTNFSDLNLNKDTSAQQSRLNQWKLPSLDKDGEGSEFSRAPGTTSKSSLPQGHSSPNINSLLGQTDTTWSSVSRSNSDTGWPDSATNDITPDTKDTQWNSSQPPGNAFADIIPEFEPGKPWKGTQIKSVEDDPSMTPGSVARSPLSLATIKDTEILSSSSKSSPPATSTVDPVPPLSLSNSPWTFNPTSSSVYTSALSKLTNSKPWSETPSTVPGSSELWLAPGKARGPPPGLSAKVPQNNWSSAAGRSSWGSSPSGWNTSWLLLRNLTPQIDGSTLKTLCRQHGPLQNFHLYLNHGIAFAKYSSREEASKAQTALNNCVLGNTTIFAESPGESDVATMLNSLGHSQPQAGPQAGSHNWNLRGQAPPSKQPSVSDTWAAGGGGSNLWQPNLSGSTLWGSEGDSHRTTPSASLNSYLPPDLLNGESM